MGNVQCLPKVILKNIMKKKNTNLNKKILFIVLFLFLLQVSWAQEESPLTTFRSGKYRKAIELSKALIETEPNNMLAYAVMGWSYLSLGQWKLALNIAKEAEKKKRNDPRIIQIIGEAYYELNEYNLAMDYIAKYFSLSPQGQFGSWMYYYLGEIYREQQKYYKAEVAYTTAVLLRDDRPKWWLSLASVHETKGELEKAREIYLKVLALDSNNTIARRKLQQLNQ